jgi:lipopolysaccharide/colanic/teichoic acid biosynthesis glycosyltransferase
MTVPARHRGKRAFDFVVSLVLLVCAAPVMLAIAIAILVSGGPPMLFRQVRPGLGEIPFTLVKFRTMREQRSPSGDPLPDCERLTRLGRWLRSTSLDELPELWHVVRGDMSLVGPRPLLPEYLERYTPEQRRRHLVRPGVTGLAQVSGRNEITWDEKLRLDAWYVDHWSFALDLRILLQTARLVLRREGIAAEGSATAHAFLGSEERS